MAEADKLAGAFFVSKRRYRCSKDHEWTENGFEPSRTFSFQVLQSKVFCMMCAVEFLAEQIGTVEELT